MSADFRPYSACDYKEVFTDKHVFHRIMHTVKAKIKIICFQLSSWINWSGGVSLKAESVVICWIIWYDISLPDYYYLEGEGKKLRLTK